MGELLWRSAERTPWYDVVTTCPSIGQTDDSPNRRSPLAGTRIQSPPARSPGTYPAGDSEGDHSCPSQAGGRNSHRAGWHARKGRTDRSGTPARPIAGRGEPTQESGFQGSLRTPLTRLR